MTLLRAAAWALALGALVAPELARHAAERRLFKATAALRLLAGPPGSVPEGARDATIAFALDGARRAAESLVGDPRPYLAEAQTHLLASRPEAALAALRAGLAFGERPELVFAMGRASAALGRNGDANAAALRAAWASPGLVIPPDSDRAPLLRAEVARLEAELAAARLTSPPPAPSID